MMRSENLSQLAHDIVQAVGDTFSILEIAENANALLDIAIIDGRNLAPRGFN